MPAAVTTGSVCTCTFGAAPGALTADYPTGAFANGMPVLCIDMIVAGVNITPFGVCSSLANPEVASATAAAQGVLTPMPCVPVVVSPWTPGSITAGSTGVPFVNETSICTCSWGGVISITETPGITMEIT